MKEFISIIILLFFPILYKMVKDWNGFDHSKRNTEFKNTLYVMIISGFFAGLPFINSHTHTMDWHFVFGLKKLLVSILGFQLFFPYLINWRLSYRFGFTPPRLMYILNHLSDSAVPDKCVWYRKLGWLGRLILWFVLFTLSIIWFVWTT